MKLRLIPCVALVFLLLAAVSVDTEASWASFGYSLLRSFDRVDVIRHDMTGWIDPGAGTAKFEDDIQIAFERSTNNFYMLLGSDATLDAVIDPQTGRTLTVSSVLRWGSLPFVVYRVSLPSRVAEGSIHTYRFQWHLNRNGTTVADPFISRQYFYAGYASMWYPQIPSEDFFDARITLHMPPDFQGFTEGRLVGEDADAGTVVYETEFATDKLGIGVGRFSVEEWPLANDGSLEVWRPMGVRSATDTVATHVVQTMEFLEEKLGPLPVRTQRVVEIPFVIPASYVSLSTVVYGGDLRYLGLEGDAAEAVLAAHETAHKWLGGVAGIPPVGSAWFAEGLSEYIGHLALAESMSPTSARTAFRNRVAGVFQYVYDPNKQEGSTPRRLSVIEVFDEDSYVLFSKGALVFRMLHRRLGDARFFEAIKTFVDEYTELHGTAADFEAIVRRLAPRNEERELDRFFRNWVRGTDVLDYALEVISVTPIADEGDSAERFEMVLQVVSQGRLVEPGEVDVEILLARGTRHYEKVALNERTTIVLPGRPIFATFDPHHWLADVNYGNNTWIPPRGE